MNVVPLWQVWLHEILFWSFAVSRTLLPWLLLLALILIWIGCRKGWRWVRNPFIRAVHLLLATLLVALPLGHLLGLFGGVNLGQRLAEELQPASLRSGFGEIIFELITFELGPEELTVVYSVLLVATLLTFILLPPWWRRRGNAKPTEGRASAR
ncbi:MAG: hypothetical protein AAGK14_01785 [Verrucomicrobiota bacterium]